MSTALARLWGKRSTVIHCLTDCDTTNWCVDVLVPRKGYSYQTDREPLPNKFINILRRVGKQIKNCSRPHQWYEALTCAIYVIVIKLQFNMFLKKSTKAILIYWLFQMAWTWAYLHHAFLSLRCTYKDWTIKSFPWKKVRLSRYGQNVWKINRKEIEYLWVKEILVVP